MRPDLTAPNLVDVATCCLDHADGVTDRSPDRQGTIHLRKEVRVGALHITEHLAAAVKRPTYRRAQQLTTN